MPGLVDSALTRTKNIKPSYAARILDALSMLSAHSDPASAYWWRATAPPLAALLSAAGYSEDKQRAHLVFFYLLVIPEFGPPPGRAPFPSYMTDDHSPIEYSAIFDGAGRARVRFSVDPVRRHVRGAPAGQLFDEYARALGVPAASMEWARVCADALTAAGGAAGAHSGSPQHLSQAFAGFELTERGIELKAYFMPEVRAHATGEPKLALVTAAVQRLGGPDGGLARTWARVLQFFDALPAHLAPSVEIVAVDCARAAQNRVKVYFRVRHAALSTVRRVFALGGAGAAAALAHVAAFWAGISGAGEDADAVRADARGHATGGLLFYYELRPGRAEPLPKVYVPVRHMCASDAEVVRAVEALYARMGYDAAARRYRALVAEAFTHRALSAGTGIHTYVTFAPKAGGTEVTTYFSPECFSDRRGAPVCVA